MTEIAIGVGVYLAWGLGFMALIGSKYSSFQWCGKPTPLERTIVVLVWPVVLFHMVQGYRG